MNDSNRRAIAYIASRLAGGRDSGAVFDYDNRSHHHFSGTVEPGTINVYDFTARAYIGGSPSSLYDFAGHHHLTISVSGKTFQGYDFGSRSHFSGTISGSLVSIYDFDTKRHHNFSV